MLWLLRLLLIGPESFRIPRRQASSVDAPVGDRQPTDAFTDGRMKLRVWKNYDKRGEVFYNFDLVRQVERGRHAKSFQLEDLQPAVNCLTRALAWNRDRK